jgi:hypothetical protein
MDNSTISTLSSPPPDFADDMEIENELDSVVSEGSTPARTSSSSLLGRNLGRPHSSIPQFIGYSFKSSGTTYTICVKSATKKEGRTFYI